MGTTWSSLPRPDVEVIAAQMAGMCQEEKFPLASLTPLILGF